MGSFGKDKGFASRLLGHMGVAAAGTAAAVAAPAVAVPIAVAVVVVQEAINLLGSPRDDWAELDARVLAQAANETDTTLKDALQTASDLATDPEDKARLQGLAESVENPAGGEGAELLARAVGKAFEQTGETDDVEEFAWRIGKEDQRISLSNLPSTEALLVGREGPLDKLDAAWDQGRLNVLTLIAFGGVGKTALVKSWLSRRMQPAGFRGARRVFGWTFYSHGAGEDRQASADRFVAAALAWFGDDDPTAGSPWDKGRRLAELVRKHKTLLYLDGLEPLQHPPGRGLPTGRLKDQAIAALLGELAWDNPGLCVVTSRLGVEDLPTGPAVEEVPLDYLSEPAGAALLKALGVDGTEAERKTTSREYAGHALALNLLGRYLAVACGGDLRRRDEVPGLLAEQGKGAHARRVMAAYETWFKGKAELELLRLVGLFDGPAEPEALAAVLAKTAIRGLTTKTRKLSAAERAFAVQNLRDARLLLPADAARPDELDCHPLVREHFANRVAKKSPAAWKEAQGRLFEHYRGLPAEQFPETLEEMAPLYAAVAHGCRAGRHQQALVDVYFRRIQRGEEYFSVKKLGAIGSELAALSGFFETPWNRPVAGLHPRARSYVLSAAGFDLRAQGRLGEAVEPFQAALERSVAEEDWRSAAAQAGNLSELFLTRGDLARAEEFARRSVDYADRSGNAFQRMSKRTAVADALHQAGRTAEASALFREAEGLQAERQPAFPLLYSLQGFQFCDLLLARGECEEVRRRAAQTLQWATVGGGSLLDIALDHLSLGRAEAWLAARAKAAESRAAAGHLDEAVAGLRKAGTSHHVPRGLLACAELGRIRGDWAAAWRDVGEAEGIAERGGMRLHLADCHLEAARLHLAAGQAAEARQRLEPAEAMVNEMGYHRRDPEVHLAWARLGVLEADGDAARARLAKARQRVDEMEMHLWDDELAALAAELGD